MDTTSVTATPAVVAPPITLLQQEDLGPKIPLLDWSAPTHPVHERSARWYLLGSIAVLGMAAYGIISGNWTLSLLTVLIGGGYFLVRREPPVIRRIVVHDHGFEYDDLKIHWEECKEFWIVRTPNYTELHILRKRGIDRELVIQTANIDQTVIRSTLSHFLPIRPDQRERLVDICIRLFKL